MNRAIQPIFLTDVASGICAISLGSLAPNQGRKATLFPPKTTLFTRKATHFARFAQNRVTRVNTPRPEA